jgi:segregation and condensation protein B
MTDETPMTDDTPIADESAAAEETIADASAVADAAAAAGVEDAAPEAPAADADAPLPEQEGPRTPSAELKAILEALIFASPDPITPRTIFRLVAEEPKEDVTAAIASLRADYENHPGLQLVEVAGGYQITTRPELHEWVRRLFHEQSTQKLTVQGLETLAVIAYKQPITALEITEIRGVNTSGVLSTLLERHLIKIVGRKNVVGRPFLYATTKEFLIRFGLKDLGDLPRIEDMAEALGFDPPAGLIEQSPREDVLPLDEGAEPEQEQEPTAAPASSTEPEDDGLVPEEPPDPEAS